MEGGQIRAWSYTVAALQLQPCRHHAVERMRPSQACIAQYHVNLAAACHAQPMPNRTILGQRRECTPDVIAKSWTLHRGVSQQCRQPHLTIRSSRNAGKYRFAKDDCAISSPSSAGENPLAISPGKW